MEELMNCEEISPPFYRGFLKIQWLGLLQNQGLGLLGLGRGSFGWFNGSDRPVQRQKWTARIFGRKIGRLGSAVGVGRQLDSDVMACVTAVQDVGSQLEGARVFGPGRVVAAGRRIPPRVTVELGWFGRPESWVKAEGNGWFAVASGGQKRGGRRRDDRRRSGRRWWWPAVRRRSEVVAGGGVRFGLGTDGRKYGCS